MAPGRYLAQHCAPTLADMKSSSLTRLPVWCPGLGAELEKLRRKGVLFRFFRNKSGSALLFTYRPRRLAEVISHPYAKKVLEAEGYDTSDQEASLDRLAVRLEGSDSFPHEVGFFLGYPPMDVVSFIENKGRGAVGKGLWKIYHDKEASEALSASYIECSRRMVEQVGQGRSIDELCVETA